LSQEITLSNVSAVGYVKRDSFISCH